MIRCYLNKQENHLFYLDCQITIRLLANEKGFHMQELVNSLVAYVQANGNSVSWQALVESVDFQERQKIPNALRIAKQEGTLKRVVRLNPETKAIEHTVEFVGGA